MALLMALDFSLGMDVKNTRISITIIHRMDTRKRGKNIFKLTGEENNLAKE